MGDVELINTGDGVFTGREPHTSHQKMANNTHRANDSFKTTTGVIGGIAFGAFLVVAVPAMAMATGGAALGTAAHIGMLISADAGEKDKEQWTNNAAILFALFLACVGLDVGLFKLIKAVK